jgi:divalent metal cation (Fe/Co/Zn/Cd) transporter
LRLELFSVAWDVLEGVVAVAAGIISGSTTLMGFGLESVIEVTAAGTLYWRLGKELRGEAPAEVVERRALCIVAVAFLLLVAYLGFDAISKLMRRAAPESSTVGIVMAAAALIAMPLLAVAKRRTGRALASEALVADSRETIASTYLALTVLAGLGLNMALGWWWSDSVAALFMVPYLLWAAWEAWREAKGES